MYTFYNSNLTVSSDEWITELSLTGFLFLQIITITIKEKTLTNTHTKDMSLYKPSPENIIKNEHDIAHSKILEDGIF